MKRIILVFFALWLGTGLFAQNKQLLYDFTGIPQTLMSNPGAETDFKWYVGVPMLSGLSFQIGSSGVSANDLFANDGVDFNTKFRERLIERMTTRDELSGTYQLELLNVGFQSRYSNLFYSFGVYNEGDGIGYWPQDYVMLLVEGNADNIGRRYDLGDLKTRGEMLNVFHFGVNKRINRKLNVGVRGKLYSSIFDFNSTRNKGFFVTRRGQNNLLSSTFDGDLKWRTSGINAIKAAAADGTIGQTVLKRGLLGGNLGLGMDFGFTYKINNQTTFTASLLDLGFIYHTNDVENFTLKGNVTTEGIGVILPQSVDDPDSDAWQGLIDDIEEVLPFENNFNSYIIFRPTKVNMSLRYNWGEQEAGGVDCNCGELNTSNNGVSKFSNGMGAQLYAVNRPRGPQTALTAFYMRRFGDFMGLKATYTVDKFSYTNIGFGLNLQAGPVNIYVLADNLLAYRNIANSRYASFQLGLNIISWGKK